MAKCLTILDFGSIDQSSQDDATTSAEKDPNHRLELRVEFLVDSTNLGENLIKKTLEVITDEILDIASDYNSIKVSALREDFSCNCTQLQESLLNKVKKLSSKVSYAIEKLEQSRISRLNKHRYFLLYSSGIIEKLQQLLLIVGRPSELEQKLYLEEQIKPFISDESTTIHCLSLIWVYSIYIMSKFRQPACELFKKELEEDLVGSFKRMDFFTIGDKYSNIFLMDLIMTSWYQFNRLIKYEDLVSGIPLLCPCQVKLYYEMLSKVSSNTENSSSPTTLMLAQLLPLIVDVKHNFSAQAQDIRHHNIMPHELCYKEADGSQLAYFIIWHLYAISLNAPSETVKTLISSCSEVIENHLILAFQQFIPPAHDAQQMAPPAQLSPHQEERFKLLLLMLNHWCEKNPQKANIGILIKLFSFFDKNWSLFGTTSYFNDTKFRIDKLTVFQLFAKMLNDVSPIYTVDGQAQANTRTERSTWSKEEKELNALWNNLMTKANPAPADKSSNALEASKNSSSTTN